RRCAKRWHRREPTYTPRPSDAFQLLSRGQEQTGIEAVAIASRRSCCRAVGTCDRPQGAAFNASPHAQVISGMSEAHLSEDCLPCSRCGQEYRGPPGGGRAYSTDETAGESAFDDRLVRSAAPNHPRTERDAHTQLHSEPEARHGFTPLV